MNRLVIVTGPRGVGKTFFAATHLPPDEVGKNYYHDAEDSANNVSEDLEAMSMSFGRYVRLTARFSDLPSDSDLLDHINKGKLPWVNEKGKASLIDYYKYVVSDLQKNLTRGEYKAYIHDTLEKLESGMVAWVDNNRGRTGAEGGPSSSRYGQFWWGALYPLYEQLFAAIFDRGVETIIMCSHLKTPWQDKRPVPGKVAPSGKPMLYKLSSLFIWLVHEPRNADGAPAGLVLKERLGKLTVEDGQWKIRRMLPRRIPHCTWMDINRYLKEGCDLENPSPGEVMSDTEKEMISELISDEQMRLMILETEKELEEMRGGALLSPQGSFTAPNEKQPEPVDDSLRKEVLKLAEEGVDKSSIARKLDVPLPRVIRILKEAGQ